MKKIVALTLLIFFNFAFVVNPASAILEKRKEENKQTILDYINFDWWKRQSDP